MKSGELSRESSVELEKKLRKFRSILRRRDFLEAILAGLLVGTGSGTLILLLSKLYPIPLAIPFASAALIASILTLAISSSRRRLDVTDVALVVDRKLGERALVQAALESREQSSSSLATVLVKQALTGVERFEHELQFRRPPFLVPSLFGLLSLAGAVFLPVVPSSLAADRVRQVQLRTELKESLEKTRRDLEKGSIRPGEEFLAKDLAVLESGVFTDPDQALATLSRFEDQLGMKLRELGALEDVLASLPRDERTRQLRRSLETLLSRSSSVEGSTGGGTSGEGSDSSSLPQEEDRAWLERARATLRKKAFEFSDDSGVKEAMLHVAQAMAERGWDGFASLESELVEALDREPRKDRMAMTQARLGAVRRSLHPPDEGAIPSEIRVSNGPLPGKVDEPARARVERGDYDPRFDGVVQRYFGGPGSSK